MAVGEWVLERCANERFPYRLQISGVGRPPLILRTQDRWPSANRNIFCLREEGPPTDVLEEIERASIIALDDRGVRLTVILDRARAKRCDFLFLRRDYKETERGSYEQIFWQTQQSMRQRRPKIVLSRIPSRQYVVRIASDEKYPWRFASAITERGRLPVGDYALTDGERLLAVVERKTFENLLSDFAGLSILRQRALELATHDQHAFVVEAPYEDFLNPAKVHHFSPSFCAKAIAELYASFPRLRIVFCSNRKTANEWTRRYFDAVWATTEMQASASIGSTQVGPEPRGADESNGDQGAFEAGPA